MQGDSPIKFRKIMKLETICIGRSFHALNSETRSANEFPSNVLSQSADFDFQVVPEMAQALSVLRSDYDFDLVFLDADQQHLVSATMFVSQLRELRPQLPIIIFSDYADDSMRYLLRSGATWHYLKSAPEIENLAYDINHHIFLPVSWEEIFDYYAGDDVKPRIEPGLGVDDLEAMRKNPEEQYIIKRLFSNSDVVQIFRMDEGFSGSRIYTVKPRHQLRRILKIGTIDELEAVREKQETLIQPRLFRQVGQIRGQVTGAQHLAGACYSLAGSRQDTQTLSQFLQDPNQVRKDLLDKIINQLRDSLQELYNGSAESEMRYWAPLYSRILPPALVIEDAVWAENNDYEADHVLDAHQLTSLSAVPNNKTLNAINTALRSGERPEVLLRGFEVAEIDPVAGIVYLHDTLVEQYAADPLMLGKEHPILRFKIHLQPSQVDLLTHPVFRRGKKIAVRGYVSDSQETLLARNIGEITGEDLNLDDEFFELASAGFLSPLENIRFLLWEVGREDMIVPAPAIAPVVHGDLNGGNVLVEADSDVALWLIDFADARAGHVYFDLAKLEVEFRTHVFYKLFREMVDEKLWDETTTTKFLLLVENLLIQHAETGFESFTANLRDYQSDWYDDLYTQFPLYFENLLYFLFSLRQLARALNPDRFRQHYPVAVFFQSISALKYQSLSRDPWQPWAKRLALYCALVHGKEAVARSKRPNDVSRLLGRLRQRSALALVTVGHGDRRKYLMQWNKNWNRFNLVGGRINNQNGDRDSFARTLQRKLQEELGLRSPKDYHIVRERQPVVQQQFSRRQHIFKEYEFRVFEIELLPRHPRSEEEFTHFNQRLSSAHENVLLSPGEINHLRTVNGRPISETTRIVLQTIGEIEVQDQPDQATTLAFHLDELRPLVTRGRAQISGTLVNTGFGKLIENILVEVLPRPGYIIEPSSALFHIQQLDAGYDYPLEIGVQPREQDTKLTLRVTYYDTRGNEYHQMLEHPIQFRTPVFSLFHLDNPYVPGEPLNSGHEAMFVGREDVFAWIGSSLLHDEQARSITLIGQRRIGKTSLLLQLANGPLGRVIRSHAKGMFLPIYFNIRDLEVRHTGELFARLSQIITRNLRNRGIVVHPPDVWPRNSQGFRLFDRYLDEVENSLPEDGRLILMMDDIDHLRELIEEGWISIDALAYLRSLMLHRSRIALILSGTHRLQDEYWQLLLNAGETWEIQRLTRRQTEQLIHEPVQPQIHYDDLLVERIWRVTGGHPYLVQLVCSRLVTEIGGENQRPNVVGINDLNNVIDKMLQEDDGYLLALWENSSADEKLILAAIATSATETDAPVLSGKIDHHLANTEEQPSAGWRRGLDLLVKRGLLTRMPGTLDALPTKEFGLDGDRNDEDAYLFSFDLWRLWLNRNHPLDEVISAVFQENTLSSPY